jgi:hypothetical protein
MDMRGRNVRYSADPCVEAGHVIGRLLDLSHISWRTCVADQLTDHILASQAASRPPVTWMRRWPPKISGTARRLLPPPNPPRQHQPTCRQGHQPLRGRPYKIHQPERRREYHPPATEALDTNKSVRDKPAVRVACLHDCLGRVEADHCSAARPAARRADGLPPAGLGRGQDAAVPNPAGSLGCGRC